jgi:hypothetical protein
MRSSAGYGGCEQNENENLRSEREIIFFFILLENGKM